MQGERERRVNLGVRDRRAEAIPRRGDVTVTMMVARRLLSRIRGGHTCAGVETAALVLLVRGAISCHGWCPRSFGTAVDRCDRAITSTRGGIAPPGGIEVDGFASRGRVSSLNRAALSLLLGLAWLILAPVASAQSLVWIGVTIYDDTSAQIRDGTVVLVVHEGSPAYATGVRPGDVLVEVDGLRIANSSHFLCLIAAHLPGETIKLSTIRAGERRTASVTLVERPPDFYVTPHDCTGSVSQIAIGRLQLATWSSK